MMSCAIVFVVISICFYSVCGVPNSCQISRCADGWEIDAPSCKCIQARQFAPTPCYGYCFDDTHVWDFENCSCQWTGPAKSIPTAPPVKFLMTGKPCGIRCKSGYVLEYDDIGCKCVLSSSEPTESLSPSPSPSLESSSNEPCAIRCMSGYVLEYNEEGCQCVLDLEPKCPPKFIYSHDSCSCVCADVVTCQHENVWDALTCECTCPQEIKCADGKILNPNCCACVCPEVKQCEAGFEFSDKTCTCVDKIEPKCPPRMIFNEAINKCVCRAIASCLPPKIFFDSEMCECACNETTCSDGTLNTETCKCEASESK